MGKHHIYIVSPSVRTEARLLMTPSGELVSLLTLVAHAHPHQGYCSQFVCLFVLTIVPVYDVCATN